jgi:hypothetical protein
MEDALLEIESNWYKDQSITTDQIQWLIDETWQLRNLLMNIDHPAGADL